MSDRFIIHSEQELLGRPLPPQLVDGLIVQNSIVMLVANYGVGKSFVALDLALSIASGQATFLGRSLRRSGPVLYVLAEGVGRFKLRVMAWKQAHGVTRALPFHWINAPVNLLDESDVDAFVESAQSIRPALVVIDTLSRCIIGADENTQAAMTPVMACCERIRRSGFGQHDGPTLLILHHTGASGQRERGSSVIPGAIETQLLLKPATHRIGRKSKPIAGVLHLSTTKQKDLDGLDAPIELQKRVYDLPGEVEANGEPATSCIWVADGSDEEPDPIIQAIQTQPGSTKNQLAEAVGGNKAQVLKRLHDLKESGVIRIVAEGSKHRLYMAGDDTVGSTESASVQTASGSGESLRDSRTGTGRVAQTEEPASEPQSSKEMVTPDSQNRVKNRVSAFPVGTARENPDKTYWIPRSKKHWKATTAVGQARIVEQRISKLASPRVR
jgi:hypothetical protein